MMWAEAVDHTADLEIWKGASQWRSSLAGVTSTVDM